MAPPQPSPAAAAAEVSAMPATTPPPVLVLSTTPDATADNRAAVVPAYVRPRHFAWADLLRRTFSIDILACPDCGGRLRLLATIAPRYALQATRGVR